MKLVLIKSLLIGTLNQTKTQFIVHMLSIHYQVNDIKYNRAVVQIYLFIAHR